MSNAPHFDIDVPSFWADPYPALARMRKEAPIAFVPQLGSTVFTRRDDIFTQEKRIDVFSSHQPAGLMNVLMGHNMMRKDGDAHMTERAAMFKAVSPRTVRDTWVKQFQAHADRILDDLVPRGSADLCKALALPLSAECLKDVTGLTNMRFEDMDAWSQAMIDGIANYTGNKEVEARCHAATAGIDAAIDDMVPVVTKHPEHLDPQRAAGGGAADGKHPRQHQACDLGRPERAARRHCGRDLGTADASRTARAGARGQGDMDRRVRGICALDCADRDVAAPRGETVVLWRRRFRAGRSRVLHVRLGQSRRGLLRAIPTASTSAAIPRRASPSAPARIIAPARSPPAPWSPMSRCRACSRGSRACGWTRANRCGSAAGRFAACSIFPWCGMRDSGRQRRCRSHPWRSHHGSRKNSVN